MPDVLLTRLVPPLDRADRATVEVAEHPKPSERVVRLWVGQVSERRHHERVFLSDANHERWACAAIAERRRDLEHEGPRASCPRVRDRALDIPIRGVEARDLGVEPRI